MKTTMKITALCSLLALSACATPTPMTMTATGGSKGDGIVEMSYEHFEYQMPVVDPEQAMASAVKRCKAWGYRKAEAFDGGISTCIIPGGLTGCAKTRQTFAYQCTN